MHNPLLYGVSLFLIDTPWYVMACVPFLEQARLKKSAILLLGVGAGALKSVAAGLTVVLFSNWRDYSMPIFVAHTVLLLLFYLLAFQAHPAKLAYTLLLLQAIATTVNFSASAAVGLLYPNVQISIASTPAYIAAIAAGVCVVYPFVWRFFHGRLRAAFAALPAKSLWLLCLPPVLFLFLHQIFVTAVQKTGLPTSSISLLILLVLSTGLVTYYVNLRTLLDSAQRLRDQHELETRLTAQAQNYENLTQRVEAARAARHDLRHHINVTLDFVHRDDKEGLLRYLDEYDKSLSDGDGPDWCENRVVNALLKYYLAPAGQAGVALDVKLDVPVHAGAPDTDLCAVFGNIFENAARSAAAGQGAFLRARCESGDTSIVLTVSNSVGKAPHGEGLGLRNVEAAAKRHGGTARFEAKDGVFYSRVLLQKTPPPKAAEYKKEESGGVSHGRSF